MTVTKKSRTIIVTARATLESRSVSRRRCHATHAAKTAMRKPPGQKGPGAARPQPRELVEPEERPGVLGVVLGDVLDRDVMGKKALDDDGAAHEDCQRRDEDEHVAEVRERLGARRALLAGAHGRLPHPGRRRRARQMPRDQGHNRRHRGGEAHPERRLANVSQNAYETIDGSSPYRTARPGRPCGAAGRIPCIPFPNSFRTAATTAPRRRSRARRRPPRTAPRPRRARRSRRRPTRPRARREAPRRRRRRPKTPASSP